MAHEAQGKSGATSQSEPISEHELHELDAEAIQNEIENEEGNEAEELTQEEIENELGELIEAGEDEMLHHHQHRARLARFIARQTIRAVLLYTRAVVRRMQRSATLRRKLAHASRRGPRAVRALVGLAVVRAVPRPFRRITRRLVGLVILANFRNIARNAGLNPREIDAAELEAEHT